MQLKNHKSFTFSSGETHKVCSFPDCTHGDAARRAVLCPGQPLLRDPTPRDEDLVVKEPSPFAAVMRELTVTTEEQRPAIDINAEAATETPTQNRNRTRTRTGIRAVRARPTGRPA